MRQTQLAEVLYVDVNFWPFLQCVAKSLLQSGRFRRRLRASCYSPYIFFKVKAFG